MSSKITCRTAAAVLLAAGVLAGCGGSDDEQAKKDTPTAAQQASTTATPEQLAANIKAGPKPKAGTPEREWAKNLCTNLARVSTPLKQPTTGGNDPVKSQRSLVRFFEQVNAQLGKQQRVLQNAGDPPLKGVEAEWQRAIGGMDVVRLQMTKVAQRLSTRNVTTQAELQKAMKEIGGEMQILSNYQNPVASLSSNPTIGPALAAEKSCAQFS